MSKFQGRWLDLLSTIQLEKYIKKGPERNYWYDDWYRKLDYLRAICEMKKRTSEEDVNILLNNLKISVSYDNVKKVVKFNNIMNIYLLCLIIMFLSSDILSLVLTSKIFVFWFAILCVIFFIGQIINEVRIHKIIKIIKRDMNIKFKMFNL